MTQLYIQPTNLTLAIMTMSLLIETLGFNLFRGLVILIKDQAFS